MSTLGAALLSIALLIAIIAFASVRPRGLPEAVVAVPAAAIIVATCAVSPADALAEVEKLLPVVGFLAAVLVLAQLCGAEGLFRALGALMAARSNGAPQRLLVAVFAVAVATTIVLSLDATVVLLAPGGVRNRVPAAGPGPPTRLRDDAPGEFVVVAAAGVESHQPARVRRHRTCPSSGSPPL